MLALHFPEGVDLLAIGRKPQRLLDRHHRLGRELLGREADPRQAADDPPTAQDNESEDHDFEEAFEPPGAIPEGKKPLALRTAAAGDALEMWPMSHEDPGFTQGAELSNRPFSRGARTGELP